MFSAPLLKGFIGFHKDGNASIFDLLCVKFPSAVILTVWSVVVLSVYGMIPARPFWHVGNEILERFNPAITHLDSASSVVRERLTFRIKASLSHIFPDRVKPCGIFSSAHSMGLSHLTDYLFLKATTGVGLAVSNIGTNSYNLLTAVANALPEPLSVLIVPMGEFNKSKTVKLSTGLHFADIFHHNIQK